MNATLKKKTTERFTLIELIVVIVLLCILAAVALPKFIDLSGNARKVTAQALSNNFAEAVTIVHGQWLAAGGGLATVTLPNGIVIYFGTAGYPTNAGAPLSQTAMTPVGCTALWNALLQTPAISYTIAAPEGNVCTYTDASSNVITYDPVTGTVNGP